MTVVCSIMAWLLTISGLWTIYRGCKAGIIRIHRLHLIPCSRCRYFVGSSYLKCPVHPHIACSEQAIDCSDFDPLHVA